MAAVGLLIKTYPALLETELNRKGARRFEVWNAGTSAYVVAQDVAAAEEAISQLNPDMLIFTVTNTGRRAFLKGADPRPFFRADPRLFAENLYFLPLGSRPAGLALISSWRLYRLAVIAANDILAIADWLRSMSYEDGINAKIDKTLNVEAFRRFYARRHGRLAVLLMSNPAGKDCRSLKEFGAPCVDLQGALPPQAPVEYRLIHPGPRVYRWYAKTLAKLLSPRLP